MKVYNSMRVRIVYKLFLECVAFTNWFHWNIVCTYVVVTIKTVNAFVYAPPKAEGYCLSISSVHPEPYLSNH